MEPKQVVVLSQISGSMHNLDSEAIIDGFISKV